MRTIRRESTATRRRIAARSRPVQPPWANWSDARLLDLRLCDLGLRIEGTRLEERILRLYAELARRGLRVRPHFWLSHEWFTPDGVPGVAIPFYLAHPRLTRLEARQMHDVEGGTERSCLQILRHEAGHAIDNAYRLHRRGDFRRVFGPARPYPDAYRPRPGSRRYVLHLDAWYAQSHPAEDFAETFAVWLTPGSNWRQRYHDWPALAKLEYVDRVMAEIAACPPRVTSRARMDPLSSLRMTLREHYAGRRRRYSAEQPTDYDRDLLALFDAPRRDAARQSAAAFLRAAREELVATAARWTGEHAYSIDQVLRGMLLRCRALRLRAPRGRTRLLREAAVLLAVRTLDDLRRRRREVLL